MEEFEYIFKKGSGFKRRSVPLVEKLGATEVLIRPRFVGICGTDLYLGEQFSGDLRLGQQWVGVVGKVGEEVEELAPGDVVIGSGSVGCMECSICLSGNSNFCESSIFMASDSGGALRSFIIFKEKQVFKVTTPLAPQQILHGVFAIAEEVLSNFLDFRRPEDDKSLVIFGGGPVGVSVALVAQQKGLNPLIVERDPYRKNFAAQLNIRTFLPDAVLSDPNYQGKFSRLVDATGDYRKGDGAWNWLEYFGCKGFRGVVVAKYLKKLEIPFSFQRMGAQILWTRGIRPASMRAGIQSALVKGRGQALLTHLLPLENVEKAVSFALDRKACMKVVVEI